MATAALLLGFAQAPLAHTHRSDPDHRNATAMPHSHLPLLSDQRLSLYGPDDDDDAQPVDWVVLAKDSSPPFVFEVREPVVALAPPSRYEIPQAPAPRAHDPPGLIKLPPRAPPV